jgi:hypothetical protein
VLKEEGLMAGTVTRWEWYASSMITVGGFKDFWVKVCHTSRDKLVADFQKNYNGNKPVQVFADDELRIKPPAYTWFGFDFSPTFEYNGEDNLIVEVHWKERSGAPGVVTYWTPKEARVCMYAGPVPCDPAVFNFVHYMRVTISPVAVAPTSLGRVKAVYR